MPIIASFDGPNRLFMLDPANIVNGAIIFNWQDFFSEVVDWRNNTANTRWIQPIRATGGDGKSGGRQTGTSVFLMNNWRVQIPNTGTAFRIAPTGDINLDENTNTNGQVFSFDGITLPTMPQVEYLSPDSIEAIEVNTGSGLTDVQANIIANLGNLIQIHPNGTDQMLRATALVELIMRMDANDQRDFVANIYQRTVPNQGGPFPQPAGSVIVEKTITGDVDGDQLGLTD